MRRSALVLALPILWALPLTQKDQDSRTAEDNYDVIVFGATPAGFAAALAAKAAGAEKVLLLEPTNHVGGMASPGGIGLRDCGHDEIRKNAASQHQWAMRNAKYYGVKEPVWQPDNWLGEKSFLEMLEEADVELRLNTTFVEGPAGVRTSVDEYGLRRVTGIVLESGQLLQCKYVIDASYEGELMIATGYVSYTFGRESNETYNESYAGVTSSSVSQFHYHIDPYYESVGSTGSKTLLKWIQSGPDPRDMVGQGDENLMAYSFRGCLTNYSKNMVPLPKPPGYDPADFELPRRYLLAEIAANHTISIPWGNLVYNGYPSTKPMKYDACCGMSSVGIDAAGLAVGYASGTRAERKEIYDKHRYYVQGLMWFWANDPAVPQGVQERFKSFGLCKDEWPDNGNFPPQLYVREAARIIGDQVYSQNDRVPYDETNCSRDSIAVGSWAFDIHEMQRVAVKDEHGNPMVYNEGLTTPENGGIFLFDIPFYVLLPKRSEMVNLAVPNCPSVSHVAFAAIREEPTLWQLGEAAGTAAGMAVKQGGDTPLHDVGHEKLQSALVHQGAYVRWPPDQNCGESQVLPSPNDIAAVSCTLGYNRHIIR